MGINLKSLQAGQGQMTNPAVPQQTVQVVAYDPVASCQNNGPISASKSTTDITPKALITEACGTIYLNIDNSASGSADEVVSIGGRFGTDGGANAHAFGPSLTGFNASLLKVNVIDGPVPDGGTTYASYVKAFGFALINEFAANGSSILVTNLGFRLYDTVDTAVNNFVGQGMTTFTQDFSTNLEYTTSNTQYYAAYTTVGGGTVVTGYFNFGGIPASSTTGIQLTIPAGFAQKLSVCIGAVQSNISYAEGC